MTTHKEARSSFHYHLVMGRLDGLQAYVSWLSFATQSSCNMLPRQSLGAQFCSHLYGRATEGCGGDICTLTPTRTEWTQLPDNNNRQQGAYPNYAAGQAYGRPQVIVSLFHLCSSSLDCAATVTAYALTTPVPKAVSQRCPVVLVR